MLYSFIEKPCPKLPRDAIWDNLSCRNQDMTQSVILQRFWPWMVKVTGQNKWHHRIPWLQKHRSRHQNSHPNCFSSNVNVKDVFLQNNGKRNAFAYISRSYAHDILLCSKALTQATLCWNWVTILLAVTEIWPFMLFYRFMTLKTQGHLWGQ